MSEPSPPAGLLTVLLRVRQALLESPLPLAAADAARGNRERDAVLAQLDDYVIPRLVQIDAPLLAVVGGSTGAGKSTLVNSLLGQVVTQSGVLRPTTRSAVLVHNPADAHWFGADRLLPDLRRTAEPTADPEALHLVASAALPSGLALLDAPDVDSVEAHNRILASHLLGAADLWLFVTSAARYADQVPWDFLKAAASRSTAVAVVLDRTPAGVIREVRSHLARMLEARGLGTSPLFTVPESSLSNAGLLPPEAVQTIHSWLDGLAIDAEARTAIIRQTLDGAIASLPSRTAQVATALSTQEQLAGALREDVTTSYDDAVTALRDATLDGTLLRGEVLARWQELVGAGELARGLETRVGRIRDRFVAAAKGNPPPTQTLAAAVESGLRVLVLEHAETAAERSQLAWRSLPAGAELLRASGVDLGRASRGLAARVDTAVRDWQAGVLDLVRTEGADRRLTARFLAYGVNGLGLALMVVIFATTAGVTGAELGVAGGTAVVGQKILEAVFGDQAVRTLSDLARQDLLQRVDDIWLDEQQRFLDLLDAVPVTRGGSERLRALGHDLADVRFAGEPV